MKPPPQAPRLHLDRALAWLREQYPDRLLDTRHPEVRSLARMLGECTEHPSGQTHSTCKDCHDAGVNAARRAVYDYAGPTSPWHQDLMRRIDSALLGDK
jgi:hypothetical protein